MSRYIDADKLCEGLKDMAKYQDPYKQNTILGVVSTIENTPTADVVEVRHGVWGFDGIGGTCSECGEYALLVKTKIQVRSKYCPNCGAKMDGERRGK